jgi:hypothetical protein
MKLKIFASIILITIISIGCSNNNLEVETYKGLNILIDTSTKFEAEYSSVYGSMNLETTYVGEEMISYLRFNLKSGKKFQIKNIIDTNEPSYKYLVHREVIYEAQLIKNQLTSDENIPEILSMFKDFFLKLKLNENYQSHQIELEQGIYIHNAILNTINRSIQQEVTADCTPHPGYFVEKTQFWCQEDYIIDTKKFLNKIIQSGYQMNVSERKIFDYLLKTSEEERFVTIDKLLNVIETKDDFMLRVDSEILKASGQPLDTITDCMQGSDLGCCGNYSGCCWYWTILCLLHDVECLQCDIWHCGPACVPSN